MIRRREKENNVIQRAMKKRETVRHEVNEEEEGRWRRKSRTPPS